MSESDNISAKIVILGEPAVGKTTLRINYIGTSTESDYLMTLGADLSQSTIEISDEITLDVQIWDIAGQENFTPIIGEYLQGAQGAILVYDMTRGYTFDKVNEWLDKLHDANPDLDNNIPFIIVGNKADLDNFYDYDEEKVLEFVDYVNRHGLYSKTPVEHINTSAKTGYAVQEAFQRLGRLIVQNFIELGEEIEGAKKLFGDKYEEEEEEEEYPVPQVEEDESERLVKPSDILRRMQMEDEEKSQPSITTSRNSYQPKKPSESTHLSSTAPTPHERNQSQISSEEEDEDPLEFDTSAAEGEISEDQRDSVATSKAMETSQPQQDYSPTVQSDAVAAKEEENIEQPLMSQMEEDDEVSSTRDSDEQLDTESPDIQKSSPHPVTTEERSTTEEFASDNDLAQSREEVDSGIENQYGSSKAARSDLKEETQDPRKVFSEQERVSKPSLDEEASISPSSTPDKEISKESDDSSFSAPVPFLNEDDEGTETIKKEITQPDIKNAETSDETSTDEIDRNKENTTIEDQDEMQSQSVRDNSHDDQVDPVPSSTKDHLTANENITEQQEEDIDDREIEERESSHSSLEDRLRESVGSSVTKTPPDNDETSNVAPSPELSDRSEQTDEKTNNREVEEKVSSNEGDSSISKKKKRKGKLFWSSKRNRD